MNNTLSKEERKELKRKSKQEKLDNQILNSKKEDSFINILCVRFGTKYGREYVERLRNMIDRNISINYEICCLTDDQHPLKGVKTIYRPNSNYSKGWWHKVHMFDPSLPIAGRILYFDLDVVIHNNIDKLCTMYTNDFLGIHDFNRKFHSNWKSMNSSVMAWNHGTQNIIWDEFIRDPNSAMRLPGDQDWIWKIGKDRIKFWPREWIQSYKWEIRNKSELTVINGKRRFRETNNAVIIPKECCVTVFHGDPKPEDVQDRFVVDNWR